MEEVKFDCILRCIISHGGLKFHTSFGEVVGGVGAVGQNTCLIVLIFGLVGDKVLKVSLDGKRTKSIVNFKHTEI